MMMDVEYTFTPGFSTITMLSMGCALCLEEVNNCQVLS